MALSGLNLALQRLPGPLPIWRASVDALQWLAGARTVAAGGGRLVALWAGDRGEGAQPRLALSAAYAVQQGLYWLDLQLEPGQSSYPDLSRLFPFAARMQRAAADMVGVVAEGAEDSRPWLAHGGWPDGYRPLRRGAAPAGVPQTPLQDYPFVRVAGDGVHEIAVGPVHAGIIEPGHFRFSVVGEKVLRLEQRLGYTHKGVEQRFTRMAPLEAHRLAGRVSGDSTVAFAWAYCMALESALGVQVPPAALWLRALLLERERVANHLGDLGALGNDAALAFGLAQFSRLREDWLRLSQAAFGHRLTMDCVVPGGVAVALDDAMRQRLLRQCTQIEAEVRSLAAIYESHAGLQDRFTTTGVVTPALAARLGLTGLAARASGRTTDLRCEHPWVPYQELQVAAAGEQTGDVRARVAVRFFETFESLRLIREICGRMPAGEVRAAIAAPAQAGVGVGWVEGWRGEVLVALELGADGSIRRCHCHDPSWQNWPALEHAVIGNIVPDFPLINKSFNLVYSGVDL
ncbi:NADH-quinone oxidoreductase subunit C [Ramlibacter sp.]|uniref:hydrogenase large subunit n=1 Tax=Ramlibacter sp. TaxID=1917967 RepID=UPI002C2653B5|nr:NADH-quinone oxidoreductase subunit C [Ramlibacter sp.]HWI82839.1 NADH-quinone oxidoreductase subunit C [Ramlibacter sp.]